MNNQLIISILQDGIENNPDGTVLITTNLAKEIVEKLEEKQ